MGFGSNRSDCVPLLLPPCCLPCSLYHSIKDVYGPLLDSKSGGKDSQPQLDVKLQDLMQQLQAGLGAAVRKGNGEMVGGPRITRACMYACMVGTSGDEQW